MWRLWIVALAITASARVGWAEDEFLVASNFTPAFQFSGYRTDIGYRGGEFLNTATSQPFVASQAGYLASMTVFVRQGVAQTDLRVSLRADANGRPGPNLGELSFPPSLFPVSYLPPNARTTTLDFSSLQIVLDEATMYHVVFRTDTGSGGEAHYAAHLLNPHPQSFGLPYLHSRDGGTIWGLPSSLDLEVALLVRATPIPEPAHPIVDAAAIVLLGCATRRRLGPPKASC